MRTPVNPNVDCLRFDPKDFSGGYRSTQCSRLEEKKRAKISYRFEWSSHCHGCRLKAQCVPDNQTHRTIVVGKHHDRLQARRIEQKTLAFKEKMHQRAAVEGSISELVRGHGLRRSRFRGFAKVELQNLLIATACNIKRWLRVILIAKKTSYTLTERLTKAIVRFNTPLSRAMASFCA